MSGCKKLIRLLSAPGTGNQRFIGGKQAYVLNALVKEDSILQGLNALMTEAYRVVAVRLYTDGIRPHKKRNAAVDGNGIS